MAVEPANPPERLLCGPGPSNVDPTVQIAMQRSLLGHMDPDLFPILDEIQLMLARLWGLEDGLTLALQATGTAGMEAGIESLVESGDTVVVGVSGYFGRRISEIASRHGAHVVEVTVDFGQPVPPDELVGAVEEHENASLLCVVQAETSTGVGQPLEGLAGPVHEAGALLLVDCVTALGGMPVEVSGQGIDYAYSCSQKCLGAPPGLAPVALSDRALERIAGRSAPTGFTFDFDLLRRYWSGRPPTYHHTAPVLHLYALHEALREIELEGAEARYERHADVGAYFQQAVRDRGYDFLADPAYQLGQLSAMLVPEGVDGKDVQVRLLREHGIEVGGGLGPDFPSIWRIGLMGTNATRDVADRLLAAYEDVLGSSA